MSSAILYAAIVAIWACVLVPRWLRLRSASPRQAQPVPAEDLPTDPGLVPADSGLVPADSGLVPADTGLVPADTGLVPADPTAAWQPAAPAWHASAIAAEPAAAEAPRGPDAARDALPGTPVPAGRAGRREEKPAPSAAPAPAERRAPVLRARRRMLATLVLLTSAAAGMALSGLVPRWLIIPPALMLAGLLVLLREAAHTDAQRARQRTLAGRRDSQPVAGQDVASQNQPAHRPSGQPAPASTPAATGSHGGAAASTSEHPEATAEVIDISARISDQLYDQYSDAADRAVGD